MTCTVSRTASWPFSRRLLGRRATVFLALLVGATTLGGCSSSPETAETPPEATPTPTPQEGPVEPISSGTPEAAPLQTPPPEAAAEDVVLDDPDIMWPEDLYDENDEFISKLLQAPQDLPEPESPNAKELDADSKGQYLSTQNKLSSCKSVPANVVWREFAPFFDYNWTREFRDFSALLLAVWRRETYFSLPARGVHVTTNCGSIKSKVVRPLSGKSLKKDLALSRKKDKALQKAFGNCSLRHADFGPLQWNRKWRLTQKFYRGQTEKALLVTTRYSKAEIRKLTQTDLADLVKYNPQALFVLGGLSLRDGIRHPEKTIAEYNTDPTYRRVVNRHRKEYIAMLDNDPSCSPGKQLKTLAKKAQDKKRFVVTRSRGRK